MNEAVVNNMSIINGLNKVIVVQLSRQKSKLFIMN